MGEKVVIHYDNEAYTQDEPVVVPIPNASEPATLPINNNFSPGLEQTSSPLDVNSIQVGDNITIIPYEDAEGTPLKRAEIAEKVKEIHWKFMKQLLMSLLRNFLCWAGVVCMFVMIGAGSNFPKWKSEHMVPVIFIFCLSLPAIGFQILRAYRDFTAYRPSIVAFLLRYASTKKDFIHRLQRIQLSPPDISMQVEIRSGAVSFQDPNHWTRTSRKTGCALEHRLWADKSMGVGDILWPEDRPVWLVVSKDYRCIDRETTRAIDAEAARFKRDSGYEANAYLMRFEYILQVKDVDPFPDAEPVFVFEDVRPILYQERFFRASLVLCLDFFYRLIFLTLVKRIDDYYVVKYIEK